MVGSATGSSVSIYALSSVIARLLLTNSSLPEAVAAPRIQDTAFEADLLVSIQFARFLYIHQRPHTITVHF